MRGYLQIVHLTEVLKIVPTLVDWFIAEWAPRYGPEGEGNADSDMSGGVRRK